MDKLNETLRKRAIELGLCNEWQNAWKDGWDKNTLIRKFYDGIDFCLSNNYPSNDFIKENFDRDLLIKNNVIVDEKRSILNAKEAAIFGVSKVIARYNYRAHGRIYIKDNASTDVTAHNNSFVIVHILGNAKVVARCHDNATLVLIKHSKQCRIACFGSVAVKEEYGLYDNP